MQNSDEALWCQLMHIARDSLEIAKCSLKLLDLARYIYGKYIGFERLSK